MMSHGFQKALQRIEAELARLDNELIELIMQEDTRAAP